MGTSASSGLVKRSFASTSLGQIHIAEAGEGRPVLLLHETPRSWDQFRDVLPILGRGRHAIAMDTLGFGDSCSPRGDESRIEAYAEGVLLLLDSLELESVDLVGHHTGGVIAVEVAAEAPGRVGRLILSSTSLTNPEFATARPAAGVDDVDHSDDGAHLLELWRKRRADYPSAERTALLDRYIVDAIKSGEHARGGHSAVANYEMEPRLDRITAPVHVIIGGSDPHAQRYGRALIERVDPITVETIGAGLVPMPEQLPKEFAAAVMRALEYDGPG